ncbi:pimeloyl-ACP methyl ester carboxylesterase [Silvibacterium bohemicum]|uniref:Pimeloyl-ACP methyl ester carboxylesterase n=1 Tax=Silvibacterium bohemicum TaxID=1577686 RepID=A0A841JU55_9BACT|nr:alpha/beta hydrolase [Silvibacterium bohemicum]MBB6142511.1 pimeloyl-ACP methyl ester carboxylesterase [Silvibacterium bohemicum]
MSNFVLVHGGWRGGWIWKRVAQLLRKDGHDVYTPTLTGLADRSHILHAGINLSTHIQDIVNLIKFEELDDFVLCGHSYGGMVISGVADQMSERISSLVYLDAWFPQNGDSIMTLTPETYRLMHLKDVGQYGGVALPPIPAAILHVNEQDRAWVDSMTTLQPFGSMTEAIRLQGNHLQIKKKIFTLASAWEPNPFRQFYERLQRDPAWLTRTIESGHDAMLDKPGEVANLLREAAAV